MTHDTGTNDRTLVDDFLRSRSEADFLRLYDRHTDGLYRFAARLCAGTGLEPGELVQEVWIRALEGVSFQNDWTPAGRVLQNHSPPLN